MERTEMLLPKCMKSKVLKPAVAPNRNLLKMDKLLPHRTKERSDKLLAMEPLSKILNAEWHATIPNRLKLLPKRANERVETAEAKVP
jgi:hypothetical protein